MQRRNADDEGGDEGGGAGGGSSAKKARVVWSVDMHQQFVSAVNFLGVDSEPFLLFSYQSGIAAGVLFSFEGAKAWVTTKECAPLSLSERTVNGVLGFNSGLVHSHWTGHGCLAIGSGVFWCIPVGIWLQSSVDQSAVDNGQSRLHCFLKQGERLREQE